MIPGRSRPPVLLSLALVLLPLGTAAWAGDEEQPKGQYTLNASLTNLPKGGSVFEIEGTAKNFPDGTLLHITLNVKAASSPKPVEAAFFMVRVDSERFKARKVYKTETFAPLQYWAQADLILSSQRKAVRDWVRRELGLPREARLVLARKPIEIGTKAEQAAFMRKTLLDLKAFITDFRQQNQELLKFVKKQKSEYPDYKKTARAHQQKFMAAQQKFFKYLSTYVAWHEHHLLQAVKNATAEMGRSFRFHRKNKVAKARRALTLVDAKFKRLLAGIESRLPQEEKPSDSSNTDEPKGSGSK